MKEARKYGYIIFIVISMILISISYLVPFENIFYTFSSPQKIIKYISDENIIGYVDGKESSMILTLKNNIYSQYVLPRINNGWKIGTSLSYKQIINEYCDDKIINVYKYKNSEDYYIIIRCSIIDNNENLENISDNKNSKFQYFENNIVNSDKKILIYFAYVNDFEKNYSITINDINYEL